MYFMSYLTDNAYYSGGFLMSSFIADPIQPKVEFAFGEQPIQFRNADENKKVGAVGCGDVWTKFILPQETQRGSDLYIVCIEESKKQGVRTGALEAGVPESKIHVLSSVDELPKDLHRVYVLTPPNAHVSIIEELAKKLPGTPIGVEKPLTGGLEDASRLENFVKTTGTPLYTIDWMILDAQPLLYALGKHTPYREFLDIKNPEAFKRFKADQIIGFDGRDIEGGGNSLADPTKLAADRPWMFDMKHAGGVLWDMISHLANLNGELGFQTKTINNAFLGSFSQTPGVYGRIGNGDEKTSDMYARVHMTLTGLDNKNNIISVMECGKNARYNDQFIELFDRQGNKLHWEIIPVDSESGTRIPGSILTLEDGKGRGIASASMRVDAYALAIDEFSRYADQWHATQKKPSIPDHLDSQLAGVRTVVAMHQAGRNASSKVDEKVYQLALIEMPPRPGRESDFRKIQNLNTRLPHG